MRIAPTLDSSIRIDAESATDWLILEMICTDASQMPDQPLAEKLSHYMKSDDDWSEIITPELMDEFDQQIIFVSRAITTAKKEPDLTGSLYIKAADANIWFGAINQARISLDDRYKVSHYDEKDDENIEDKSLKAAVIRYHFYTSLQSVLLQYILD